MNIFDNGDFKCGDNLIGKFDFPILWSKKIRQLGDFYDCQVNPPKLLSRNELNEKYSTNLNFLSYHRITTSIKEGTKIFNFNTFQASVREAQQPRIPLLFKIAIYQSKGCNFFYKTLSAKDNLRRSTIDSEKKWHEKLDSILSVPFWDKIYKLPPKCWFQINIFGCRFKLTNIYCPLIIQ